MPIALQVLRQRLYRIRPDVKLGILVDVIQDATRQMCIETCYARDFATTNAFAGNPLVGIPSVTGRQLLKIHAAEWIDGSKTYNLAPANQFMAGQSSHPNAVSGDTPEAWSAVENQMGGIGILLYPTPKLNGSVRVVYSYAPDSGDSLESIPINAIAEMAISYLSQAILREIPGDGFSITASELFRKKYDEKKRELISIGNFGISGSLEVSPQPFGA